MALPYAVLMPLMPEDAHGALTGYYSCSRGLGTWLGPLLGGIAISTATGVFAGTHGYQAVWGVCAVAVLASLLPLRVLRRTT
jgi:MFS family permease